MILNEKKPKKPVCIYCDEEIIDNKDYLVDDYCDEYHKDCFNEFLSNLTKEELEEYNDNI